MPRVKTFHVVVNPAAGHGKASEFVETHVAKLLDALEIPHIIHTTSAPKDAGRIGLDILKSIPENGEVNVIIAGGDGTAHELIEGVAQSGKSLNKWNLIILPLGTANALHASLFPPDAGPLVLSDHVKTALSSASPETTHALSSLLLALNPAAIPRRLPITTTSLLGSSGDPTEPHILSHIVLSTTLHAALLSDSEALRAEHPGVERFKMAAEANLPIAFQATSILSGQVLQYSPKDDCFVAPFSAPTGDNGEVTLEGPFSYFLSTTTANRLEPTFVIAPTLMSHPATEQDRATFDLIILRPHRDPVVRRAEGEDDKANARGDRLGEAMGWAYQNGSHVKKTYSSDGQGGIEDAGDGEVVCEIFRCEGFDWIPTDPKHERSHLICADGSIHTIAPGGRARVGLLRPPPTAASTEGFFVWG